MSTPQRIVSLLPSATEIVCALGARDRLVAVTHECDWPPDVRVLPHVTKSAIDGEQLCSREIDEAVRDSLAEHETIYHLNRDVLADVAPDLVLTQELCDVCAVGKHEVAEALASLSVRPSVLSLEPRCLGDVLDSILSVGRAIGELRAAVRLFDALSTRLDAVREAVQGCTPVRVLTVEWIDPLFVGGHWVPEMVEIAGGVDVLGVEGKPSQVVSWQDAADARPDVVIAMLCGFDAGRSCRELETADLPREWNSLQPVHMGRVWVTDGSAYFSRPGPRLIDGIEILASILHPGHVSPTVAGGRIKLDPSRAGRSGTQGDADEHERAESENQRIAPAVGPIRIRVGDG